jgi:NAD(P)-dependent dehydrogenase (short-subunit alcohol dehydrogenase family)
MSTRLSGKVAVVFGAGSSGAALRNGRAAAFAFAREGALVAELVGEVERYEDNYRLCYVRGPEGIIVELAEQIG